MPEQTVVESLAGPAREEPSWIRRHWRALAIASLVTLLYADVVFFWMDAWWINEMYSHGFLVAPIALYMAWRQKAGTLALAAVPSSKGLYLTALAMLMYVVGRVGAEFFTTRLSLILLLCGITVTFWGWPRLRRLGFPLLLLASVIPLPVIIFNKLAAPMQLIASGAATRFVQLLGISIYRDGNVIQLPNMTLGVVEACSGLRSLASLTVGALLLGYLEDVSNSVRVLIFLLAFPIAILFNIIRVAGTALLAGWNPDLAEGFYHFLSGWLVFVAGFGTLFAITKLLRYVFSRQTRESTV